MKMDINKINEWAGRIKRHGLQKGFCDKHNIHIYVVRKLIYAAKDLTEPDDFTLSTYEAVEAALDYEDKLKEEKKLKA
jgi:hypothetical protein